MPRHRNFIRRSHRKTMTASQMQELWLGANHNRSHFVNDADRREMWWSNRDRIMELWGCHGRRPVAWWFFEAPEMGLRYPGSQYERSVLWEAGVLSEDERAALEREWREAWEFCWRPNFFHCARPGKIYNGDEARVRHLVWADVPPELVYKWPDERERCGPVVCEPQETSQRVEAVAETGQEPVSHERRAS